VIPYFEKSGWIIDNIINLKIVIINKYFEIKNNGLIIFIRKINSYICFKSNIKLITIITI